MSAFKKILPDVYIWSKFSEEKQLDFNGTLLISNNSSVLIDPVEMSSEQIKEIHQIGLPEAILISNKDHRRAAPSLQEAFGDIPIWIHQADEKDIDCTINKTFKDGDLLPLGIVPIHLEHFKSPGETAFYWPGGNGVMIVGDALIRKPKGFLSLLPPQKVPTPDAACISLNQLLKFKFDKLILGDGEPILSDAHDALSKFLAQRI